MSSKGTRYKAGWVNGIDILQLCFFYCHRESRAFVDSRTWVFTLVSLDNKWTYGLTSFSSELYFLMTQFRTSLRFAPLPVKIPNDFLPKTLMIAAFILWYTASSSFLVAKYVLVDFSLCLRQYLMSELTSRFKVTRARVDFAFVLGCPHAILKLSKDFFTEWLLRFKLFAKASGN